MAAANLRWETASGRAVFVWQVIQKLGARSEARTAAAGAGVSCGQSVPPIACQTHPRAELSAPIVRRSVTATAGRPAREGLPAVDAEFQSRQVRVFCAFDGVP